jgi:hypothetical protein
MAQIVHAPVPNNKRPMTIQMRIFNLRRMRSLQSGSLPRSPASLETKRQRAHPTFGSATNDPYTAKARI